MMLSSLRPDMISPSPALLLPLRHMPYQSPPGRARRGASGRLGRRAGRSRPRSAAPEPRREHVGVSVGVADLLGDHPAVHLREEGASLVAPEKLAEATAGSG